VWCRCLIVRLLSAAFGWLDGAMHAPGIYHGAWGHSACKGDRIALRVALCFHTM
jgi:hypothetical protein